MGRRDEYSSKAGTVNRHIARFTSPYPWSGSLGWCVAEELAGWYTGR